jgi:hypothetical protein
MNITALHLMYRVIKDYKTALACYSDTIAFN